MYTIFNCSKLHFTYYFLIYIQTIIIQLIMKKNEREVKVKIVPLLCWDIYFNYLDTKFGNKKDIYFKAKQMKSKQL